jgi:hypothetical protein
VVVWAFAGIAVPQTATPVVAGAAWLLARLVLVMLLAASQSVWQAGPGQPSGAVSCWMYGAHRQSAAGRSIERPYRTVYANGIRSRRGLKRLSKVSG